MNDFGDSANAEFIEFECNQCKSKLKLSATLANRPAKCPKCGTISQVPPTSVAPSAPAPVSIVVPSQVPSTDETVESSVVSSPATPASDLGEETATRKLYRKITEEVR